MRYILLIFCFNLGFNAHAEHKAIVYDRTMTVDGFELEYTCKGTHHPITILEPPSGNASEDVFKSIFEEFASITKTCVYARLGNGNDNRAEGLDLTGLDYVRQLEEIIRIEANQAPVILVGYSYGSFVARLYASKHPEKVKGLLLLDPPHSQWMQSLKREMIPSDWEKMNGILNWFKTKKGHNFWDTQFEVELSKLKSDLPVVVISRGQDEIKIKKAGLTETGFRQFNDFHFHFIKKLIKLTNNTQHIVAPNSRHLLLEHEPEIAVQGFVQLNQMIKTNSGANRSD